MNAYFFLVMVMAAERMGAERTVLLALGAFFGVLLTHVIIHYLRTRT